MKRPLISVIIPVFRVERFLRKCVDSIIAQTYENLEIILVDDGSDDECPRICDEYEKKDSRIRVIHQENGGLSAARNTGLRVANGEYISFIDGDDYIDSDMYEIMMNKLEKDNADIAIVGFDYVDEEGNKIIREGFECPIRDAKVSGKTILQEALGRYGWYYVIVCNRLSKRKCWENIKFPLGKLHEDEFVLYDVFVNVNNVVLIEGEKYHYVQNTKGIMNSQFSIRRLDCLEAFNDRLKRGEKVLGNFWSIRMMSFIESYLKEISAKMDDSKETRARYDSLKSEYEEIKRNVSPISKMGYKLYVFLREMKRR